jgi:adenylate cyclase
MQAMTEKVKRRLTTVLCADVHGYSRLMEADEAGTLATLHRCRTAIAGLVERHDGRIVNTWGDAVIAEFGSVVEAVQCAVEIQQELSDPDPDRPDAQRMRFRIGINLGDIIVDGSDIYGAASISRRGCKNWPSLAISWSPVPSTTKCTTNYRLPSIA